MNKCVWRITMVSFTKIKQGINKKIIMPRLIKQRSKIIENKDISIISSNCIGGILSHDYGLKFNSPTVNLSFSALDFIKFIEKLEHYLDSELTLYKYHESGYPICNLDDIKINFVHYNSIDECVIKWNQRKERINFD